jgi:hypothetical protein
VFIIFALMNFSSVVTCNWFLAVVEHFNKIIIIIIIIIIVGNPPQRNNWRIVESRVFFGVRPQAIAGKARQDI